MLFDELDIERQLAPDWAESKLYCSAKKVCPDGSLTIRVGHGQGCKGFDASGKPLHPVWVPNNWKVGDAIPAGSAGGSAGKETAEKADVAHRAAVDQARSNGASLAEAEEGTNISPEAKKKEREARWQDQCFLIEGWRAITDKFQECSDIEQVSNYEHIIPILAESSDVVSILANRANANLFFSLTPAQLSMLVPSIRLFIVNYKQEKTKGGPTVIKSDDEPAELYLDDHTEGDLVKSLMTGAKGRAEAIGLQNFSYEFDGKDPATTDSLIKASLKLVFTSFDTLLKEQDNGAKFLDLMLRTKKMISKTRRDDQSKSGDDIYNWCKKGNSEDAKETDSNLVFNPQYRRIKASIGWAIPPGNLFFELFPPDIQEKVNGTFKTEIINLLESLKLHLFLEMTDYDLNFSNDGKIELSINYRAAVEGELSEPEANIFFRLENQVKSTNKKRDRELAAITKERKEAIEDLKKKKGSMSDEEYTKQRKKLQDASNEEFTRKAGGYERRAAATINGRKLYWYSYFLDELQSTNRLIAITLKKGVTDLWRGSREFLPPGAEAEEGADNANAVPKTGISAGEILKSIFDAAPGTDGDRGSWRLVNDGANTKHISCRENLERGSSAARALSKALCGETVGTMKDMSELDTYKAHFKAVNVSQDPAAAAKKEKEVRDNAVFTATTSGIGDRAIYFTFLGDILDTAMKFMAEINVINTPRETNIRLLTSQINFIDPGARQQGEKRKASLNIADVPIAFDEFLLWFNNKVIKSGRTNYPVMDFIKDVITDLAFQAFGYNCVGGSPGLVPMLNYTLFQAPLKESGAEPLVPGLRYNGTAPLLKIHDNMKDLFVKSPSQVVNYVIIHGASRSFVNKNADSLEQDERDGIYHFGIGLDRGILKEINFSGNTLKYATETRVIEDGQSGLEQLFEKFDATVQLYGCPIFRNGQYLYLDPRTMGVSSDVARAIGLGGYYNIYNVSGELNRASYTMELKCKYQGSGLCGDDTIDASRNTCVTNAVMKQWKQHNKNKQVVRRDDAENQQSVPVNVNDTENLQSAMPAGAPAAATPPNPAVASTTEEGGS